MSNKTFIAIIDQNLCHNLKNHHLHFQHVHLSSNEILKSFGYFQLGVLRSRSFSEAKLCYMGNIGFSLVTLFDHDL